VDVPTFVQIAVSSAADDDSVDVLYGLAANGRVWRRTMSPNSKGWIPVDTEIDPRYAEED
jgi:hypothetical protein